MEKKAFLVYFAPIVRVIAPADADDETLIEMAIRKMFEVGIEQFINTENCDNIEEDIECPYDANDEAGEHSVFDLGE